MAKHRYNLIRFDTGTAGTSYKLFVRSLYDYVIVKEVTTSDVTERSYFVAAKDLQTSWTNRASLTYSIDIRGRKLVNEGQNWLAAAGRTFTGLLDTYGGAAAAYSLQLLSTDYSGNCVTVRRASDNTTLDIGFSNNELDIATLETFCNSTNGFITKWYDQSGNGVNATQTTASSQPQIVSSGSVILENGKPAISYDGVDDCFATSSNLTNYTDPAFLAFVGQVDTFPSAVIGKLSGINRGLGFAFDDIRYRVYREGFGTNDHLTSVGTSQVLVDFQMINGVTNLYENTIAIDNPQNTLEGLTFDGDTNGIGVNFSSQYYDGKMQTIVLYHTDESSNRTGIETILNDYYNIY